jgi:hypothetical protein
MTMKTLLYCTLLTLAFSCTRSEPTVDLSPASPFPDYPDWYVIQSPVDRTIEGVWGDYDKTLLISTMFQLFRSTDQGKTWQSVHEQRLGMFSVVSYQDSLFTMSARVGENAVADADNFSVDDGKTWQPYTGRNPILDLNPSGTNQPFPINPVTASNGTSYRINRVFLDGPTATTGQSETPGVITGNGLRIDLPQLHQLQSLYLDTKQRLYITATDAVCGGGQSGKPFSFCNSKGGRGVVYISKNSLP